MSYCRGTFKGGKYSRNARNCPLRSSALAMPFPKSEGFLGADKDQIFLHSIGCAENGSNPSRNGNGGGIVRVNDVNRFGPTKRLKSPVQAAGCRLGGVSLAPNIAAKCPADLLTRPAGRGPRASAAYPATSCLLDY